jgi:hypothetical protein
MVPMKAPGTLHYIAKGALVAASLQGIGPSPCTPAPPPRRAVEKAPAGHCVLYGAGPHRAP